jgi:hypothetical protein
LTVQPNTELNRHGWKRRSAQHRQETRLARFWRAYRFELIWVLVVILGIFFLLEPWHIRVAVYGWLRRTVVVLSEDLVRWDRSLTQFVGRLGLGDIVGLTLLAGAVIALLGRIRWRLTHTPALAALQCPLCGSSLYRIHRTGFDHLIGLFVPIYRYHCSGHGCHWSGRRVHVRGSRGRTGGRSTVSLQVPATGEAQSSFVLDLPGPAGQRER